MPLVTTTPDNFDALLTTTLQSRQQVLVDNIHNSTPFLAFIDMRGRKTYQDGGESILIPLLYAKHDGYQDFQGYQTLDVDPVEGITAAQYVWKEAAIPVTISRRERRQNSGRHAIIKLLDAKTQQAELAAADGLNERLLGTNSANSLKPVGLQDFLQALAVGSQTGTVGGIDKASYSWWNNQYENASSAFSTNGRNKMRTVYNKASQGSDHPDIIVTTRAAYENYERIVEPIERIQRAPSTADGERIGSLGFDYLMYKGAFMFWDDNCLANRMYMINTRYVHLVIDTQSDWAMQPFITPNNQAATTALILWMGAFTFSNLARQGVVGNVDTW